MGKIKEFFYDIGDFFKRFFFLKPIDSEEAKRRLKEDWNLEAVEIKHEREKPCDTDEEIAAVIAAAVYSYYLNESGGDEDLVLPFRIKNIVPVR